MKANEAPEKLYISTNSLDDTYYISDQYKRFIEYTRTDSFIEKAVKYIANHFLVPGMNNEIEDFINYMKGE